MLATDVLTAHHNELRGLMARVAAVLDKSPDAPTDRRAVVTLLNELTDELTMHEMIEDAIFYPAVANVSAMVSVAHPEHRQIADQLAAVLRTPVTSDEFAEQFGALRTAVEHHAEEEEDQMFPTAARRISSGDLELLGKQLTTKLGRLRASSLTRNRLRLKRQVLRHTPSKR